MKSKIQIKIFRFLFINIRFSNKINKSERNNITIFIIIKICNWISIECIIKYIILIIMKISSISITCKIIPTIFNIILEWYWNIYSTSTYKFCTIFNLNIFPFYYKFIIVIEFIITIINIENSKSFSWDNILLSITNLNSKLINPFYSRFSYHSLTYNNYYISSSL